MKRALSLLAAIVLCGMHPAFADGSTTLWNLPIEVSNANTEVHFEIDSTWHVVKGTVGQVNGSIWLESAGDPNSIRAELHFPVESFDTGNRSRDKEMRQVMAASSYPTVTLMVKNAIGLCDPASLRNADSCKGTLDGTVTIRDITKPIAISVLATRRNDQFEITGTASLRWNEFGVEDPSILIARLDTETRISFKIHLPDNR